MGNRLAGKTAIITGAARGQGEAEARLFVSEGAKVVLADILVDQGEVVAAELGQAARFVRLDVTSASDWTAAVAAAEAMGPLTILVNNAGIGWARPLEYERAAELRRALEVNLVGPFLGLQAVIRPMRAAGGGSIVNISSMGGLTGLPYLGAYGASKSGLVGLSRTAALELAGDRIRVNTVHPGPIYTAMLGMEKETFDEAERFSSVPLKRPGDPEEVAALVLHLASDESSYQTGGAYVVDGGLLAGKPPAYTWEPTADDLTDHEVSEGSG